MNMNQHEQYSHHYSGLFITFEGPDGAGKSTQIQRLVDVLADRGLETVLTREPGGTRIADKIRALLLAPEHSEMTAQAEVLLYAASRAQHVHELILPSLVAGNIVFCDRFVDASMAYQSYGLGIDQHIVSDLNRFASSNLTPDRTYMIDISEEVSMTRLQHRAQQAGESSLDRIEQRHQDYHRKVREGFLHIAQEQSGRIVLIDGNRDVEEIGSEIEADFMQFIAERGII